MVFMKISCTSRFDTDNSRIHARMVFVKIFLATLMVFWSRNTHGVYEDLLSSSIWYWQFPHLLPWIGSSGRSGQLPWSAQFRQPVLLHASPFATSVSSAGSSCRSGSRLERAQLSDFSFHGHHFNGVIIRGAGKKNWSPRWNNNLRCPLEFPLQSEARKDVGMQGTTT